MAIPATSLAAVTVDSTHPGVGTPESLGAVFSKHAGFFTMEGWTGSGGMSLYIEGSLDGDDWFEIAHTDIGLPGPRYIAPTSAILALYIRARATAVETVSATVTGVVVSAA